MELTVLLAVGLCIATISEVSVASRHIKSVRACKPKHKKHSKHQEPSLVPEHPRLPAKPTCKGVECTNDEVCHLVQVQCLVAPCPLIASCVPKDKSPDSEEDWIDDPNRERKPEEVGRDHSKGGSNAAGETAPSYQDPIFIKVPWKGDRTVATRPLEPAKDPKPRKPTFQNVYNPDSHKNPIPNSSEVPFGTKIPHGPSDSTVTDVNLASKVPEEVHHGVNTGPLIPVGPTNYPHEDGHGIHKSPGNPDYVVNPGGPLIPVDPTKLDDSVPDPESQILHRGKKRDNLGSEASLLHREEIHGGGSSVRERHPKVRACRTKKRKHRHDQTPKKRENASIILKIVDFD